MSVLAKTSLITIPQARAFCLLLAVLVYGACGTPTPDAFGWAEGVVGALLLIAIGAPGVQALYLRTGDWRDMARMVFIGIAVAGLLWGALRGNPAALMLRDLIAFGFLFLPLLCLHIFRQAPEFTPLFLKAVIAAALLFSLRALLVIANDPALVAFSDGSLDYFANAPTLPLAAFMLIAFPAARYIRSGAVRDLGWFAGGSILAALPLLAMALTLQRASIGFVMIALSVAFLAALLRAPARAMVLLVITFLAAAPFMGDAAMLAALMHQKTLVFGLNMRAEEWQAVWQAVSETPLSALLGLGWGGTFESPAVAGIRVNFTHSLLSSALLKTGLLGLAAVALYLAALGREWLKLAGLKPLMALALAGPLLIDMFLYASYKSLDFGLVLLLVSACLAHCMNERQAIISRNQANQV